jgi:hypothetical protein
MSGSPDSRAGVLCAGTILVDVGKVIDAYPALDHLATIEQVSVSTGGPGLNMAVDLRMLGAIFPIGVLGAVGDDQHAAFILAECARLGIETAGVRMLAGAVTSFTDGMIERDGGRRTFSTTAGLTRYSTPRPLTWRPRGRGSCTPARQASTRSWTARGPTGATAGRPCCGERKPPACTPTWKWSAWSRAASPTWPCPACRTSTAS